MPDCQRQASHACSSAILNPGTADSLAPPPSLLSPPPAHALFNNGQRRRCSIRLRVLNPFGFYSSSMDWAYVHKIWEKWASNNVGTSGKPLKAALLINYDPTGPSRLLSTIAEQEGIKANPIEISQFVNFIKCTKLQNETFFIASNEYMVTSIHENWFHGRCMKTSNPAGEGAILMQTTAFLLLALYDGSIGSASGAVAAAEQFALQLSRKNL